MDSEFPFEIDDLLADEHVVACLRHVTDAARTHPRCHTRAFVDSLDTSLRRLLQRELRYLARRPRLRDILPDTPDAQDDSCTTKMLTKRIRAAARHRAMQWRRSTLEILERLETDWEALVRTCGVSQSAHVIRLSKPMSNLQFGGRSAYRLTFDDERGIVYKPRSVQIEHLFGMFVDWLHEHGCTPTQTTCRTLPRLGYGWAEYIRTTFCTTPRQNYQFYRRQGAFGAIFFVLAAFDCTAENVVVSGDHPVWVDMECLCQPEIPFQKVAKRAPLWMRESVLTSLIVQAKDGQNGPLPATPGLDRCCTSDRTRIFDEANTLRAPYLDAFIEGFSEVYEWMLANRGKRHGECDLLSRWRHETVRVVLRSTGFYGQLRDVLRLSPMARRPLIRKYVAAALRGAAENENGAWPDALVASELAMLERGDVPYWTVSTCTCDLTAADGSVVRGLATVTGFERASRNLARLSRENLQHQIWLLRSFLSVRPPGFNHLDDASFAERREQ